MVVCLMSYVYTYMYVYVLFACISLVSYPTSFVAMWLLSHSHPWSHGSHLQCMFYVVLLFWR
jgi:hypothetical protein